jgi:hypothetical protein
MQKPSRSDDAQAEDRRRSTSWLDVPILTQPDDTTCGPTCLHAVYAYHGLQLPLQQVVDEVPSLDGGGTLGVLLGTDALRRGFDALLVTYNLMVFDPTWFQDEQVDVAAKLKRRWHAKDDPRLRHAVEAYLLFLELGGRIRFEDLTPALVRRILERRVPILTGLSATYLYACTRERYVDGKLHDDDVRGDPQGHFVVLSGYDRDMHTVHVSDPLRSNPLADGNRYEVDMQRLLNSILLGIMTYDANLLIVQPHTKPTDGEHAHPPRR